MPRARWNVDASSCTGRAPAIAAACPTPSAGRCCSFMDVELPQTLLTRSPSSPSRSQLAMAVPSTMTAERSKAPCCAAASSITGHPRGPSVLLTVPPRCLHRPPCPAASRPPAARVARAATVTCHCLCGRLATGHHGANQGHQQVRGRPLMLPRHSPFVVVPPPAATGRFPGKLLYSNRVRDLAGEFD
jgi:hypothetical protein